MYVKHIIKFLLPYFKKYIKLLIIGGFFIILFSLLILPTPLITRYIIDVTIPDKNIKQLIILIIFIIIILISSKLIGYYQNILFYKINNRIVLNIKLDLLAKINRLPLEISKKIGIGYFISRINDDTIRIQSLFIDTLIRIIKDILTFVIGFIAIFVIHWKLAILSVSVLPFFFMATIYFSKLVRKLSRIYFEDYAQTTKRLEESLNMLELSKVFFRHKYLLIRYFKKVKRSFRSQINLGKLSFLNLAVTGFLGGIAPVLVIGYGGYEIIQERLTLGSLIAFNIFIGYLFNPANRLINVNMQIQKSLIAMQRIRELFNLPEEKIDKNIKLPNDIRKIRFVNVNYSYGNLAPSPILSEIPQGTKKHKVLKNVSFKAIRGEKIGIVGTSGVGKTTLINIISGLYKIDKGEIILNKNKLNEEELITLRKKVGIVEQEPFLFNDTIYQNIKFGKRGVHPIDIYLAAKKAYADKFIRELPEGYKTIVGEKGTNLSVGQKQRIAIARALISKPKILILDEATSNIDNISIKYINRTIFNLSKEIIIFIVTHKLNTIKKCDKILVLDNGKIVEQGNHEELLDLNGYYYQYNKVNLEEDF